MVDYARSVGARPFLLTQTGLVHLPTGQDPEQAYDGICFPEASGHDVFYHVVANAHSQAKNTGVFEGNVGTAQTISQYHEDSKKNAQVEWLKWSNPRLKYDQFGNPYAFDALEPGAASSSHA